MYFSLQNDNDILLEFGKRYESIRLDKQLSDNDVSQRGGVPKNAIYRFKNGQNISTSNFIKILRGLDILDKLDTLFEKPKPSIQKSKIKTPKRIFKSKKTQIPSDFEWGDDK